VNELCGIGLKDRLPELQSCQIREEVAMRDWNVLALVLVTTFANLLPMAALADIASWCPEGQRAFSAGKYEAAGLALNNCLYSPPEDPELAAEGYYLRGEVYLAAQDYEAALGEFEKAVELDADFAPAWRSRAWVYYKQDDLHAAVVSIDTALEADPGSTQTHHVHAQILTAMGRQGGAMDAYDLAYAFESRQTVQKLQQALADQGYEVGSADGVYGNRTRDALKQCIADGCIITF
jgi:tetratricopeptide (TPR) repeat protein